jgi:single-stranded-DNA-specific exonuclease
MRQREWILKSAIEPDCSELSTMLGVSPFVTSLLIKRGIDGQNLGNFLRPSLDQLHDPYLMLGMREAVKRVMKAIENNELILIYGDYDVDGTTGTVLLRRALKMLGGRTSYFIPHRFTDGYGLHASPLERAKEQGCSLVISVDCGIRSYDALYWARDNGLDVIVTDHHLPDEILGSPPAFAVLNPNQQGCKYPDKFLAGVGVAFKLVQALMAEFKRESLIKGFLKVVAIGTVADMAPLMGENRSIVSLGLNDLHQARNAGLRALLEISNCSDSGIAASDLGFRVGPRINAAGRMDAARAVVELFEAEGIEEARRLADYLDKKNRERQILQRETTELALHSYLADEQSNRFVAVVAGEKWHRGVIGLAASKITEKLSRPSIVISLDGDYGHGSARSVGNFHILDALTHCSDLLKQFGGHSHAAGLVVERGNVEELRRKLNIYASGVTEEVGCDTLYLDAELSSEQLDMELLNELQRLEPFGCGWEQPVFATRDFRLLADTEVIKGQHLKFKVKARNGRPVEAIWWNSAELIERTPGAGESIEIAYSLQKNSFRGNTNIQLNVYDINCPSWSY